MTALQVAILAGVMVGVGVWLIGLRLAPTHPNLAQTLAMLSGAPTIDVETEVHGWEAFGQWGLKRLPERIRPIPTQDLAILSISPSHFLAKKMVYALVGLTIPGALVGSVLLLGSSIPVAAPAVAAVVVGGAAFMIPDVQVRTKARRARVEFSRTLSCFVNLVALERSCGSGTKQALDVAAGVGDSWVFAKLRECLDRSTWAGVSGRDGLQELAKELGVNDLGEVADIIALSSTEGAGIYRILRAKSRSIREGLLLSDITRANEANEKMSLPVSILGIVFLAILIGPALLSMTTSLP